MSEQQPHVVEIVGHLVGSPWSHCEIMAPDSVVPLGRPVVEHLEAPDVVDMFVGGRHAWNHEAVVQVEMSGEVATRLVSALVRNSWWAAVVGDWARLVRLRWSDSRQWTEVVVRVERSEIVVTEVVDAPLSLPGELGLVVEGLMTENKGPVRAVFQRTGIGGDGCLAFQRQPDSLLVLWSSVEEGSRCWDGLKKMVAGQANPIR